MYTHLYTPASEASFNINNIFHNHKIPENSVIINFIQRQKFENNSVSCVAKNGNIFEILGNNLYDRVLFPGIFMSGGKIL